MNETSPGLGLLQVSELNGMGDGYGYNFLGDGTPVGGPTSDDLPLSRGEFLAAQRRQLIIAALGGLGLVALGGVVTYFVTRSAFSQSLSSARQPRWA
jgi:hypothetical protein